MAASLVLSAAALLAMNTSNAVDTFAVVNCLSQSVSVKVGYMGLVSDREIASSMLSLSPLSIAATTSTDLKDAEALRVFFEASTMNNTARSANSALRPVASPSQDVRLAYVGIIQNDRGQTEWKRLRQYELSNIPMGGFDSESICVALYDYGSSF